MKDNIIIRKAHLKDLNTIVDFNQKMALESEGKELEHEIIQAGVRAVLNDSSKGFYLVLLKDDQLLAQLMITFEWSDWRNGQIYWIQSVYVAESARRKGFYSRLYEEVKKIAETAGNVRGIRLYVEKENMSAQKVYEKLGMKHSHYFMYETKSL